MAKVRNGSTENQTQEASGESKEAKKRRKIEEKRAKDKRRLAKSTAYIRKHLRVQPNFPQEGILFCDISGVLCHKKGARAIRDVMLAQIKEFDYDAIIVPEARGFIVGMLVASDLKVPIILARKPGKLPFRTYEASGGSEYEDLILQAHRKDLESVRKKCAKLGHTPRVLIVDDLAATGGTLVVLRELLRMGDCEAAGCVTLIDLATHPIPNELKDLRFQAAFSIFDDELKRIYDEQQQKKKKQTTT